MFEFLFALLEFQFTLFNHLLALLKFLLALLDRLFALFEFPSFLFEFLFFLHNVSVALFDFGEDFVFYFHGAAHVRGYTGFEQAGKDDLLAGGEDGFVYF